MLDMIKLGIKPCFGWQLAWKFVCRLGDEAEAVRCYTDAHRMFPANMDVISWLGAFHVKNEVMHPAMLHVPRLPIHQTPR